MLLNFGNNVEECYRIFSEKFQLHCKFRYSEVAADSHELIVLYGIMRSSIARPTSAAITNAPPPQPATLGLQPVAHTGKLLLICRPTEG